MKIRILDEAEQDLIDGARFYENQEKGLGAYFVDSLLSDIESLYLFAGVHVRHGDYYRLLSKRFPFAVYYTVDTDTVMIWAILACRRDPATTDARLNEPRTD